MKAEDCIKEYLKEMKIMQLATVRDGQPWICTVNVVVDDQQNLYWMSQRSTRHSKELVDDSRAAGAVVRNVDDKQCVHFEGEAFEVAADDFERVHALYGKRYGANKDERLEEARSGEPNARTYYVIKPKLFVLFDLKNFPTSPRQEWRVA